MKDKQQWTQWGAFESRLCDIFGQEVWFKYPLTGRWRKGIITTVTETKATLRQTNGCVISIRWEDLYS